MSSDLYKRLPLQPRNREIRVAVIEPGPKESQLAINLRIVSLDDDPLYDALSYTWGTPQLSENARLNAIDFAITPNVDAALRRLRSTSEPVSLWVDLLCIDQSNNDEKATQVPLMGDIYRQANHVWIWLGREIPKITVMPINRSKIGECFTNIVMQAYATGGSLVEGIAATQQLGLGNPFEMLEDLSQTHIQHWPHYLPSFNEEQTESRFDIEWLVLLSVIYVLITNSWWSRSWIVQEVVLSRHQTVLYGQYECSWSALVNHVKEIHRHSYTCCNDLFEQLSVHHRPILTDVHEKIIDIDSARQLKDQTLKLGQLEPYFRYREATDPRDKIYAFLGFMSGYEARQMTIDYNQNIESVYTDYSFAHIRSSRSLAIFALGDRIDRTKSELASLPSWVPDWTVLTSSKPIASGATTEHLYNASGLSRLDLDFVRLGVDGRTLTVRGLMLSEVKQLSQPFPDLRVRETFGVLKDWAWFASTSLPSRGDLSPEYTRFWMTCFAGCILDFLPESQRWSFRRCNLNDRAIWDSFLRGVKEEAVDSNATDFEYSADQAAEKTRFHQGYVSLIPACLDRQMLILTNGYLCMGFKNASKGDQIWVVEGAGLPLILRKVDIEHSRTFQLIGTCYIHGCMDGEAVTGGTVFETINLV